MLARVLISIVVFFLRIIEVGLRLEVILRQTLSIWS